MEMTMKKTITYSLMAAALLAASTAFTSCEKVSPQGVLMGNTSVDDRVKQSLTIYSTTLDRCLDKQLPDTTEAYSFLVGSDSHITIDPGRLSEMLEIGLDHDDLFYCHLGDLADTKAEYYFNTDRALDWFKRQWMKKYITLVTDEAAGEGVEYYIDNRTGVSGTWDEFSVPFYPVVGNHDITHNGWALFSNLFKSSFYEFTVQMGENGPTDRFIFLDSANGTLGNFQIDAIEDGVFELDKKQIRNTFVFTHTNIFRPSYNEFASTYCREELYYLLDKLADWKTTIMFCGHVHAWDDRMFGGVRHITMPSMNFVDHPNGGDDLLVRITVKQDGSYELERVGLYSKQLSKEQLLEDGYKTDTK